MEVLAALGKAVASLLLPLRKVVAVLETVVAALSPAGTSPRILEILIKAAMQSPRYTIPATPQKAAAAVGEINLGVTTQGMKSACLEDLGVSSGPLEERKLSVESLP